MQPPRATPGQGRQGHAQKGRVSRARCPSKDPPWPGEQGKEPGRPDATWDEVRPRWTSISEGTPHPRLCSKGPWAGLCFLTAVEGRCPGCHFLGGEKNKVLPKPLPSVGRRSETRLQSRERGAYWGPPETPRLSGLVCLHNPSRSRKTEVAPWGSCFHLCNCSWSKNLLKPVHVLNTKGRDLSARPVEPSSDRQESRTWMSSWWTGLYQREEDTGRWRKTPRKRVEGRKGPEAGRKEGRELEAWKWRTRNQEAGRPGRTQLH